MDKPLWLWVAFFAIVLFLLVLDLGVLHKKNRVIGIRESLLTSAGYITVSLLFGAFLWWELGPDDGSLFITGYLVEKSLSLDNIFVISLILSYFRIPPQYQHRVLFWGILGVIVLRGIMIGLGATIVAEFHWVLYIFAAFLVYTGIKMLFVKHGEDADIAHNPAVTFLKKHLLVTAEPHGEKFFVMAPHSRTGKIVRHATPLFLALAVIEFVDLIFAVDSIPAILSLTTDPYIVYTSNIFAILGLRALYFALSFILTRFVYLKYALALVLVFIGSKVFVIDFFGMTKFPPLLSLVITLGLLAGGIIVSLIKTRNGPPVPLS